MKTPAQTRALIEAGRPLLIAGAERLLRALPRGRWLGGSIPYFMTAEGGVQTEEKLFVTQLPPSCLMGDVRLYAPEQLSTIPGDYPAQGLSFIIIPAGGEAHSRFAKENASWPGFFERPLVGWIAGVGLQNLATEKPMVINGLTGEVSGDAAGVLHVALPPGLEARTEIINLFEPAAESDVITFTEDGFSVRDCKVNGQQRLLAEYLVEKGADLRWPLVADFSGARVNVSFQALDAAAGRVTLYAPVFAGVEYRLAQPLADYEGRFMAELLRRKVDPVFTCNCVLNYVYAELQGKKTGHAVGPFTFGEIAWMLLNQTLVYVTLEQAG